MLKISDTINHDIKDIYAWPLKAQVLLLLLSSIVLFYFGYLLDVSLLKREIQSGNAMEENLKLKYQQLIHQQIMEKNELKEIPQLIQKLNEWNSSMISEIELTKFLDQILKIGSNDHLRFNVFQLGSKSKTDAYQVTPVKINVAGNYDQIASFISQIANIQKVVQIDDFTLSKEAASNGNAGTPAPDRPDTSLVADIKLNIYEK